MRKHSGPLLLALFASLFVLLPASTLAQDELSPVDRILNPFPEFHPFTETASAPQFFPDEVDGRVRQALIDGLTHRQENLPNHIRFFREKDREMGKTEGSSTGLAEPVIDLWVNGFRDRERFLEAQKNALKDAASPKQRNLIGSRIRNDELTRADELLQKNRHRRWGAIANRFLKSMDLLSIVTGSYAGAAADAAVGGLLGSDSEKLSVEERKALALYREHLKRHPEGPESERVAKEVETLEKKKKAFLVQQQLEKAEKALEEENWDKAEFHSQRASLLDPEAEAVKDFAARLEKFQKEGEEDKSRGLSVESVSNFDAPESDQAGEQRQLLYALSLRDPDAIEFEARKLRKKHGQTRLGEAANDALAVALEIRGEHEKAKEVVGELARSSPSRRERERAAILLRSPEYNRLAYFEEARVQRRMETVKFVLLGEDLLKKNLLLGTGPLVAAGPAGATSLAAANVLMLGTNLFQVLTNNPISQESIIDRGVAYIRNHPDSENATDVYRVLGEAYEEAGVYDRAIAYYEMSGKVSDEEIADLRNRAAKTLLRASEKNADRSTKELYLRIILEHYPQSDPAQEARRKLSSLKRLENRGLKISKKFLLEHPELYGPEGLRLKPILLDGNPANMELSDKGVNLLNPREIMLQFETPWGTQSRTYSLHPGQFQRFLATLRMKNYDLALEDVHIRGKGSLGGFSELPRSLLEMEVRDSKEEPGEAEMAFVREASGPAPDHSKVLDYELLSENEKNPGSTFRLPPMRGNISGSGMNVSGDLPTGIWGNRLVLGTDASSPFAGIQLPIPLLQGFIPVDFMLQTRPGRFSLFPKIHLSKDEIPDPELYR